MKKLDVEKMRRQLRRTAAFECGRRGCSIDSRAHWHYLSGPGQPEEIVYVGSEREAVIENHERAASMFRSFGRRMDEIVLGSP